ncbi:CDP-alcohol phosphatidyltransferase family protein [Paenibacillus lentus]|uniref:CDP-alcohol phosphatidyltransferase family protein n=1 Tax=Paenibacillus lentus TaxID=1338368 RepID=UPI003649C7F3
MKNIPNSISILRLLLSVFLLFVKPFSITLWVVYFICGFSDMIDGYLARKFNLTSQLGEKLDSIADMVLVVVMIVVLVPILSISIGIYIWIAVIGVIRVAALLVGFYKYCSFASLHTYANKVTGLLLFGVPFFLDWININILGVIMCTVASLSAIEELIVQITSKELSRNVKSILAKK